MHSCLVLPAVAQTVAIVPRVYMRLSYSVGAGFSELTFASHPLLSRNTKKKRAAQRPKSAARRELRGLFFLPKNAPACSSNHEVGRTSQT